MGAAWVITESDLHGAWTLVRWEIDYGGRRPNTFPFGNDATGLIVYSPDGWMSATMSCRQRTAFSAGSARQASAETKASVVEEYLSYGGRWRIEGAVVVHDVVLAVNPSLLQTRQIRTATLVDGQLQLCADESDAARGFTRVHTLLWQRAGLAL